MVATFLEAILEGGIENPNFFNGKVLTAQDLRDLQSSSIVRARRLGQALGDGVAYGLFVGASSNAALSISAGLAINRRGDALLLPADITLPLQASQQAIAPLDSPFAPCDSTLATTSVAVGFFLLAITPATELSRTQAQHTGLNAGTTTCTSRYEVEGVQFKLIPIEVSEFSPTGSEALHRSRLAHACFGTATLLANFDNPFHMPAHYGLPDDLRASGKLLDCEVPLAVLHWSGSQIRFVDQWSARRPCSGVSATTPYPLSVNDVEPFPQHASARRRIEAQAILLQFQEQLEAIPRDNPVYEHMVFLPSAGYLPLGTIGFGLDKFFPNNPSTLRELDPGFVRLVLEQSFFIEPVPVITGQPVDVDFFHVQGASDDFILFARREQVVVTPPEDGDEPSPPGPPGPVEKEGTIVVTVTDPEGKTMFDADIQSVTVSNARFPSREDRGSVIYTDTAPAQSVATQNQIKYSYRMAIKNSRTASYGQSPPGGVLVLEEPMVAVPKIAVYVFKRPPGLYTVASTPNKSTGLRSNSTVVLLGSGQTKEIQLALIKPGEIFPPGGGEILVDPEDVFVLPHGHLIDEVYLYPDWPDRFPRDPGYIDPLPDDWLVEPPVGVKTQIEDILGGHILVDSTMAAEDPKVFVNTEYDPDVIQSNSYAFVQTADGQVIPLIFGAGDSAIRGDVDVGQVGLADLDAHTQSVLHDQGLGLLNAFNGAWTGLISGVLGLDEDGASSLLGETRAAGQGFQGSFTRYPGVSAQADTALKASSLGDDVALANASAADVLAALNSTGGVSYTEGFAIRLIERARGNVQESAWSLASLGMSDDQIYALEAVSITSAGQFTRAVSENRTEIKSMLNLTDTALDLMIHEAQAGAFASRLQEAGSIGVAKVEGVGGDLAELLVSAGYNTATDLSNADVTDLAQKANISAAEAVALKQSASQAAGTLALIQAEFGLEEAEVNLLKEAGIAGVRDMDAAPEAIGNIIGGDRAGTVSTVLDLTMNRPGFVRFR